MDTEKSKRKKLTALSLANQKMRQGRSLEAIEIYKSLLEKKHALRRIINFNIELSEKRAKAERKINLTLEPNNQISKSQKNKKTWISEGTDPNFKIKTQFKPALPSGFYKVTTKINSQKNEIKSKIYLDHGAGYSEEHSIPIIQKNSESKETVILLKEPAINARFDPLEDRGEFEILDFSIIKIGEAKAIESMLDAISEKNKNTTKESLLSDFEIAAKQTETSLLKIIIEGYKNQKEVESREKKYEDWIVEIEQKTIKTEDEAKAFLNSTKAKPKISVIINAKNKTEQEIIESINSVKTQTYPHWEICITSDDTASPSTKKRISDLASRESRIKHEYAKSNGSISTNLNLSIMLGDGGFITLIEAGDQLPKHALISIAEEITKNPEAKIIYSDEDIISTTGARHTPHFKSDWNPDLLHSQNYISNTITIERSLLVASGGFRTETEHCKIYDLILRSKINLKEGELVAHIPKILYHRKEDRHTSPEEKNQALLAISEYFAKNEPTAKIQREPTTGIFRVQWPLPEPQPLVSIIIPTRDHKNLVECCINSILEKTIYRNYEILIIDNQSKEEETKQFLSEIQKKENNIRGLSYDHPFNYSAINNFGVQHALGEIIVLLNNDIEVISPDWLNEMVSHALRPNIGCVGAKLYYSNNTIQHAGIVLGIGGVANHPHKNFRRESPGYFSRLNSCQNYIAVTAACLAIRKSTYLKLGGLDEENLKVAYNDVDLCLKSYEAGYLNVWTPHAELYHHESISRGSDKTTEKIERLAKETDYMTDRWENLIKCDPFYNINLTRNAEDFGLCDSYTKPLTFEGKSLYSWSSEKNKPSKKHACVFVNFDKDSKLHDYVIFYLEELSKIFDITFVSTSEHLHEDQKAISTLQEKCKNIIVRKNEGYDFGSWRLGLEKIESILPEYSTLLLCNDSTYGPLQDLSKAVREFEKSDLDVMGASDSREIKYHIQSYFVLYKKSVFLSDTFKSLWSSIKCHSKKWDIIENYEIGFSQKLLKKGYKLGAICDSSDYPVVNICHAYWRDLLEKKLFPFIKIELLRDNPINIDISGWEKSINSKSKYNTDHIKKHLPANSAARLTK